LERVRPEFFMSWGKITFTTFSSHDTLLINGRVDAIETLNCAILGDDCADLAAVASLLRALSRSL
jgi:hypothetical protein